MVSVREYADAFSAETIRIRLAAAGIRSLVTGTDAAVALSMGGAGTDRLVRIEVASADYQRAVDLLRADERLIQSAGPWICSRCEEQNEPAFEVCWSCNKRRSEQDATGRHVPKTQDGFESHLGAGDFVSETSTEPINDSDNPYHPPTLISDLPEHPPKKRNERRDVHAEIDESVAESVKRAYLSSIVGILVFPPLLNFYSLYVTLKIPATAYRDATARRKLIFAWVVNSICILLGVWFWTGM
ncbi:hypothetical protein Pla52o_28990 [Novipirellula galeiformis]|uniref:RanBP2-type domain-containing protein n=2 Tax=Novipirellula galeiformis TaxID=2528004 RepID=A0A5C6CEP2_9BACT|nr:hypothetical protein Pla52o_28990 [Novipirellula galeiformis]